MSYESSKYNYKNFHSQRPGRPSLYEDPQDLLDYAGCYIHGEIDNKQTPNRAGLIAYCFGSESSMYRYMAKPEYKEAFEWIGLMMEDATINDKNIDAGTKKLILQSKYGYSDKIETVNKNETTIEASDEVKKLEAYKRELEEKYGVLVEGE